ncbi:MAG: hypothetical protein Q9209_001226 [Squamulea sp. 1 TL-2023]
MFASQHRLQENLANRPHPLANATNIPQTLPLSNHHKANKARKAEEAKNAQEATTMTTPIPTSTSITESAVIPAHLSHVWHLIKLQDFHAFWSKLKASEFVKGASPETDVVKWEFHDGTVLDVKQEEHSVQLFLDNPPPNNTPQSLRPKILKMANRNTVNNLFAYKPRFREYYTTNPTANAIYPTLRTKSTYTLSEEIKLLAILATLLNNFKVYDYLDGLDTDRVIDKLNGDEEDKVLAVLYLLANENPSAHATSAVLRIALLEYNHSKRIIMLLNGSPPGGDHYITYSIIASTPALSYSSVVSTIRCYPITSGTAEGQTFITWSGNFSSDADAGVIEDARFKRKEALADLAAKVGEKK